MADRRSAGPAAVFVPALAALLMASSPAFARPHGSPDLTPSVFLPRHPDFELLSQVDCLSGPCGSGSAIVAQAPEPEPEAEAEEVPEPPSPAPAPAGDAGPAARQDGSQQRAVPAEAQGTEPASPALAAGAAGAARLLSPATAADAAQQTIDEAETVVAEGAERPAGALEANETLVPTLPAGDVADNTGPEADDRAAGDLVVASLPEAVELGAAGEVEDNTIAAGLEAPQSGLMSLRGRQAALDEALGVGGFGQSEMLGLRRLSLTSPGTIRADTGATRPSPPRTALRDLVTSAGPARAPGGPMDSDERQAVRRHAADRRPEPTAPDETEAPVAPTETAAPARPAAAPAETAPAAPRAPASAPGGGAGAGTGGGSALPPPNEAPG